MKKTTKAAAKQTKKTAAPKASKLYAGEPIIATKLFVKDLPFKNCAARCFMALNEQAGDVTYINAYGKKGTDDVQPRASFDPVVYTFPVKAAVVTKKMNEMVELEVTEWPSFVQIAPPANIKPAARRGRKAAAK